MGCGGGGGEGGVGEEGGYLREGGSRVGDGVTGGVL